MRRDSLGDGGGLWYSDAYYSRRGYTGGGWRLALAPAPDSLGGEPTAAGAGGETEWWAVLDSIEADPGDAARFARDVPSRPTYPSPPDTFVVAWPAVARGQASAPATLRRLHPHAPGTPAPPLPPAMPALIGCDTIVLWPSDPAGRSLTDTLHLTRRAGPSS